MNKILLVALLILINITANAGNLSCQFVRPIVETMLGQHLLHNQFNSNLQTRTVEQYIKWLDPQKTYFLKSDVDDIKKRLSDIHAQLGKRECGVLDTIQQVLLKRVEQRKAYAEKYLGSDFKINRDAKIDMDVDKREWAASETDLNKLQENYIQFQVASFVASDMKMDEAKDQVRKRYDRAMKNMKENNSEDLYVQYLDAAARSLDPHSSFLSSEDLEDFEIQMRLSLDGIGATLSSQDGYTVIEQLVTGGAAAKSGQLQTQDKILAVGQGEKEAMESVIDLPLKDVVRKIRGPRGTKVRLSILRKTGGKVERFNVTLVRQKISLEEDAAKITYIDRKVDGKKRKLGIIDLPSFYADTKRGGRSSAKDVKKILVEAKKNKVDGLVLDLSNNGGGSLEDAVQLAGLFIKTGNIVATQGNKGSPDLLADDDASVDYNGPLVVLTSRLSASASEIVSGALKDYKRAVIVGGDHTFGKGSVQSVVPLPNQLGAIKITVGMFYVPGGDSTQHSGVTAHIPFPGAFARDEVGEKSLDYSLPPKSIKPFLSPTAYVEQGDGAWKTVEQSLIAELKTSSEKRISSNEEFKKIKDEMVKTEAKGKVVTVAEVLDKKDETKANEEKRKKRQASKKVREEEYLKRPDIQESLNVLDDLINLMSKSSVVAQGAK